ncbi:hypothetical protein QDR37_01570 [Amnibacterium sp. CER49]|uniref:hypothetical protein n=1 Tax=Amnibacterium sp. CER49 TaxID=3039161 RepID=UPI002448A19A|nr:hypothetical protein [Amnibacterium sp. CER49]MDH2442624.1 hypothetical protein [Amnibacterium sp. CER49]
MLRVLCSESELGEYGERLAIGDRVDRVARRDQGGYFGTELDEIVWRFDRYAEVGGADPVRITGTVTAIAAVYVEMTQLGSCTWTAAHGTAHQEPLTTTTGTRRPVEGVGIHRVEEGDERLAGWLVELEDERIAPA